MPGLFFKLMAENAKMANPSLPVGWCLEPEGAEWLKEHNAQNSFIFFVVETGGKEVLRKLVPLKSGMEYLYFDRPGPHTIYAVVICCPSEKLKELKRELLGKRYDGIYRCTLIHEHPRDLYRGCEGEECGMAGDIQRDELKYLDSNLPVPAKIAFDLQIAKLAVNVAEEFFAEEPPAWLEKWVNLCFTATGVPRQKDECQFRPRKVFAFTLQPIGVLVWLIFTTLIRALIAGWYLLLGSRGINFKAIIHPWRMRIEDVNLHAFERRWVKSRDSCVGRYTGDSVFLMDKEGKTLRPWWMRFFIPIIPVSTLFFGWIFYEAFHTVFRLHFPLWYLATGAVALPLMFIGLGFLGKGIRTVSWVIFWRLRNLFYQLGQESPEDAAKPLFALRQERELQKRQKEEEKEKQRRERELARVAREYELLACRIRGEAPVSVGSLPPEMRTVRLRFLDLKARVCKRYAAKY